MAAASSKLVDVGARYAKIYALNQTTGIIDPGAASATAYNGILVKAVQGLELTVPEPQVIYHLGDDRPYLNDTLPAAESSTATLTTGQIDLALQQSLTGNIVRTVNEKKWILGATNNQGNELFVCMLIYSQSLDADPTSSAYGQRRWRWMILPKVKLIPQPSSFGGAEGKVVTYTALPQIVTSYPWGTAFVSGTDGATQSQFLEGVGEYKPMLAAWKGDNVITAFNLPVAYPAQATGKITAYIYDTSGGSTSDDTSGAVLTTTTVTPSAKPDTGDIVIAFYEHNSVEST